MFKKALFTFLTLGVLATSALTFMVPQAHAQMFDLNYQGPCYFQGPFQWYTKVYDTTNQQDIFGERYTNAQVQWVIYSLFSVTVTAFTGPELPMCVLTQDITGPCTDAFKKMFGLADAGTIQYVADAQNTSLLSTIFAQREFSGVSYVREKAMTLHIIPQVQAQTSGFGYGSFTFIQKLWQGSRDIMYALMILIIIAMAFMIMFRTKISPQAVITVQSALPKVIVTLILITFSYAIAGLLVDLMYVVIGLISLLLSQSGIIICPQDIISSCPAGNPPMPPQVIFDWMINGFGGLGIVGELISYWARFQVALLGILATPTSTGGGSSVVAGGLLAVIIEIIVSIFLLTVSFKVIWMLIKTFIQIILSVITAPFIIGFGAISRSAGFAGWLKGLISHLAVYPLTGLLFWVSTIFLSAAYNYGGTPIFNLGPLGIANGAGTFFVDPNLFGTNFWAPPLTLGTTNTGAIRFLWLFASVGIIAIIPKTVELIQSILAGKPFAYGSAIGEAVSPAAYGQGAKLSAAQQANRKAFLEMPGTPSAGRSVSQAGQNVVGGLIRAASGGKIK